MLTPTELLKLDLMTNGVRVSEAARGELCGADGLKPLTLNDYASTSGVSLQLNGDIWVNAPLAEFNANFVSDDQTSNILDFAEGRYVVRSARGVVAAQPVSVPQYSQQRNTWGEPYTAYAITHTDRVRISPIQGCAYVCTFCDLPYDKRYTVMRTEGLVDAVEKALSDPWAPARHVLISGGVPRESDFPYLNGVYEAVCKAFPDTPVDVMMTPAPGLLDANHLHDIGVSELSINIELFDEEIAKRIMPRKAALTLKHFLDFIDGAVSVFGLGRVRSLLLVGIEPLEATLKGVTALAERGCVPVLSPFRPDPTTPLKNMKPPSVEMLVEAYERSAEIVKRHGIYLGTRCMPCSHNTLTFPKDVPAVALSDWRWN